MSQAVPRETEFPSRRSQPGHLRHSSHNKAGQASARVNLTAGVRSVINLSFLTALVIRASSLHLLSYRLRSTDDLRLFLADIYTKCLFNFVYQDRAGYQHGQRDRGQVQRRGHKPLRFKVPVRVRPVARAPEMDELVFPESIYIG